METRNKNSKNQEKLLNIKDSTASKVEKKTKTTKISEEKVKKYIENSEDEKLSDFDLGSLIKSEKWRNVYLKEEIEKDYFKKLSDALNTAYSKETVYPPKDLIFNAFNLTELENIKVVILGQDPYHDKDQAHGLAFSVPKGVELPRSLKNIYKELENDIDGFKAVSHGCFLDWAEEGVFLLNTILTVREHEPNSHSKIGWEIFTDRIIELIVEHNSYVVFILWGNSAHKKEALINADKHGIIKAAHPSPLSFNKFFNSKCFSKANDLLVKNGKTPIKWHLTE